ncbi:AraC family transcriptional regulator [Facklamia sp. 7083-14-GEN3]|uniref:helix-turn-helix domain-containing protein n=1 Tax=Facklamia sp. 7083-14-GEN3 TaxID=2973478 RepID=UPI00215C77A8|nr:AraC family transcriptional regulator [Facklamia sp. 7083-14-GEN3]MCR8968849.1 AraC family transcriptional regulator [Facklamia sp. 7083-14-GEN3]
MYNQSTKNTTSHYFSSINTNHQQIKPFNRLVTIKNNRSQALLRFNKPVILTEHKGLALLVLTDNPDKKDSFQYFILQNAIQINAGIYFNTLSLTTECKLYLEPSQNEEPQIVTLKDAIKVGKEKKHLKVEDVFGLHYQVYSSGERILNHPQNYYELIFVDQGQASMELSYKNQPLLSKNSAWLNFPGQKNQIAFKEDGMTTLISILFTGQGLADSIAQRPIHLGHRQIQLLSRLVNLADISEDKLPFYYDEIVTSLQLILTQMHNGDIKEQTDSSTSMRENYENELFQSIIDFLQENIGQLHQVNDLVEKFNVSRSSLQTLFNKYTGQTPKQYINSLRLKQSKLLIHESKMTLSEIANELGYGSIQYFSRAFSNEFGISPSNYAKSIVK